LPERQREALALRELEELSYDEIAEIMDMNRNSVAQLISRARISLRDELRGGALASIAVSSPECERALPLIAMRDDGQLDVESDDSAWLDGHMSSCHTCRLGLEAMQEAGTSYRAWTPIAAAPWLFKETLAKAAELTGSDWSETIAERAAAHDPAGIQPGMPSIYRALQPVASKKRRRRLFAAAGLGAAALLAVVTTAVLGQDDPPTPAEPAATTIETVADPPPDEPTKKKVAKKKSKPKTSGTDAATAETVTETPQDTPSTGGGTPSSEPQTETQKPDTQPRTPTKTPPPDVEPEPDPVIEEPPVVEEPPPAVDPPPGRGTQPPPIG
jgi:DNA-binding CsgD family transcriptional regulator